MKKIIENYSYWDLANLLKNDSNNFANIINNHFDSNISITKKAELISIFPPAGGVRSWNYYVIEDNITIFTFNDYSISYKDMVQKIYLYLRSNKKQQIVQETGCKSSFKLG